MDLKERLSGVHERIAESAGKAGRKKEDITLICVSKNQPFSRISEALSLGERHFGENRVQELLEKWEGNRPEEASLHFLGHLQTNKVSKVVGRVQLLHSLDSVRLLHALSEACEKQGICLPCLVEIHSGEETKFGIPGEALEKFLEEAAGLRGICIRGLMTIAPLFANEKETRLHFERVHKLFVDTKGKKYDNVDMSFLSMGMSRDFQEAILEGANMVRVGTALFGERK